MDTLAPDAPTTATTAFRAVVLVALLLLGGCGSEDSATAPSCATDPSLCPPGEGPGVEAFLQSLPSWQSFANPDTVFRNEVVAEADTLPAVETVVDSVPVFDDTGVSRWDTEVRYVCQARPFTISDAPERIIMFDPNRSILYAGALLQGRSRKELGSLLALRIAERRPITVSIPDLPTGANQRQVIPTQGNVESARGEMIGDAVKDDLATPSSSTFKMESYHSERSFALSAGLSGRYLGFEGNASGSLAREVAETTVTAHYYERMYTVTVEPPTEGFFSDDLTPDVLDAYVDQGVIGPDNLPIYVSEIVYGRMMMFSVTSTATAQEIRSAMQASYNTFTGSVSGSLDQRSRAVLENSRIAITAVGGSGEASAAMIRSGDWSEYFASSVELSQAVPLSYTFTNVGDGSIAAVTEATDYTINECFPRPIVPGTFEVLETPQDLTVPLDPGYETVWGDVNGDGREDMIFHYTTGSTNEVAVALAGAGGSFSVQAAQAATVTPAEGWSTFDQVLAGDFDGDGNDDLVFNRLESENAFYVALSNGNGTFRWGERQQRTNTGWGNFRLYAADVDNANGVDLVWNSSGGGANRTYVALSAGDGTFDLTSAPMDQVGTANWNGTDFFLGDVNGDGFIDLIHSRTRDDDNANWVSIGRGDGTFNMGDGAFTAYGSRGWGDYQTLAGDMNGDRLTDLFFIADRRGGPGNLGIPVHRATGTGSGRFAIQSPWHRVPNEADGAGPYELRAGDVDADGDSDLIMVDLDSSNNKTGDGSAPPADRARIWVGLGTVDQVGVRFDFSPRDQYHPAREVWGQYAVHVADVNGDGKTDVILHWNTSPHRVYVGLAR